jgi:hypothetical protein
MTEPTPPPLPKKKDHTLLIVLVVLGALGLTIIPVVGLLVAIAIPALATAKADAELVKAKQILAGVAIAKEVYEEKTGKPATSWKELSRHLLVDGKTCPSSRDFMAAVLPKAKLEIEGINSKKTQITFKDGRIVEAEKPAGKAEESVPPNTPDLGEEVTQASPAPQNTGPALFFINVPKRWKNKHEGESGWIRAPDGETGVSISIIKTPEGKEQEAYKQVWQDIQNHHALFGPSVSIQEGGKEMIGDLEFNVASVIWTLEGVPPETKKIYRTTEKGRVIVLEVANPKNDPALTKALQSFKTLPPISRTQEGNITRYETAGNLAASGLAIPQSVKEITPGHNPVDIAALARKKLEEGEYDEAFEAATIAAAYGTYDTRRVADKSAHQGMAIIMRSIISGLPEDKQAALIGRLETVDKQAMFPLLKAVGKPSYHPSYMIQHGIRAFSGEQENNGIVPDFDEDKAWAETITP